MLRLQLLYRRIRRFFQLDRSRKASAPPVYVSDIRHKSRDEWQNIIEQSPEKAARWMYSAAVAGYVDAQLAWAQMQLDGRGTARDPEGAFRWFSIAAQSNSAEAINLLGRCHARGWGTSINLAKAAEYYRRAADQSFDWAQFNLGNLLLNGTGVPQDIPAALALFEAAAMQGHVKSFHMVGLFHEHGFACPQNASEALVWYQRAAEAGEFRGQYHLGMLLAAMGDTERGVACIKQAIANAPDWFMAEINDPLLTHSCAEVRQLARPRHSLST